MKSAEDLMMAISHFFGDGPGGEEGFFTGDLRFPQGKSVAFAWSLVSFWGHNVVLTCMFFEALIFSSFLRFIFCRTPWHFS